MTSGMKVREFMNLGFMSRDYHLDSRPWLAFSTPLVFCEPRAGGPDPDLRSPLSSCVRKNTPSGLFLASKGTTYRHQNTSTVFSTQILTYIIPDETWLEFLTRAGGALSNFLVWQDGTNGTGGSGTMRRGIRKIRKTRNLEARSDNAWAFAMVIGEYVTSTKGVPTQVTSCPRNSWFLESRPLAG
ncbi:hypothetical protein PM082_000918 [Marasmius tenuissimus]|nr:hypothetical protein PM082_000918 [Marasmius tenuissimus]